QSLRNPDPYDYDWQLEKWDARSKTMLWSVPGYGGICLLDGGAWLLQPEAFSGATLRSAADGSVLRTFSDTLEVGWGPVSGTKVAVHNKNVIRVLDVATGEISGSWLPMLSDGTTLKSVYRRLHPDGRRVAVIGMRGLIQDSWFAVGDVLTGETLLEHRLIYPFGQISISDDGRYATATDPSRFLINDSHPTVDIFNLEHNQHLKRFVCDPEDTVSCLPFPGQAYFIPESDLIVVAGEAGLYRGVGPLVTISLSSLTIEQILWSPLHYIPEGSWYPEGASVGGVAVGSKP
ncbi:MAG TPA: hypothetical protein VNN55_00895, partial [bacterium]|nr:hypothetical protein [bacterium]